LVDSGQIKALQTQDNVLHYDGDTGAHSHFVCKKCNRIIDLDLESGLSGVLKEKGFEIESENLVLFGFCPDCKGNIDKE